MGIALLGLRSGSVQCAVGLLFITWSGSLTDFVQWFEESDVCIVLLVFCQKCVVVSTLHVCTRESTTAVVHCGAVSGVGNGMDGTGSLGGRRYWPPYGRVASAYHGLICRHYRHVMLCMAGLDIRMEQMVWSAWWGMVGLVGLVCRPGGWLVPRCLARLVPRQPWSSWCAGRQPWCQQPTLCVEAIPSSSPLGASIHESRTFGWIGKGTQHWVAPGLQQSTNIHYMIRRIIQIIWVRMIWIQTQIIRKGIKRMLHQPPTRLQHSTIIVQIGRNCSAAASEYSLR